MRLVWTSDFSARAVATGFSRVSRYALQFLSERGHELLELGVGYTGTIHSLPWQVVGTTQFGGRLEGQEALAKYAYEFGADAAVLLEDVPDAAWAVLYQDREGKPLNDDQIHILDQRKFALCLYAPVDGARVDGSIPRPWPQILHGMNSFDAIASPSRFGAKLLGGEWVPHGVDVNFFAPDRAPRDKARELLGIAKDRFVVGYIAVNKPRKMVPAFFEAGAKLLERNPKIPLTMVFLGQDREGHYDIQGLVDSYGLEKKGAEIYYHKDLLDGAMLAAYGALDILAHPGSEGFGLPIIEAAAMRVPALTVDYAGGAELVPDAERGFCKIPIKALIPQPYNVLAWPWWDTDVAAERLEAFWSDKALRLRLRRAAWEHSRGYAWDAVLPKLEAWLLKAVEDFRTSKSRIRVVAV